MSAVAAHQLSWTASVDAEALAAAGCEVVRFAELKRDLVAPARRAGARRTTLANPAQAWLERVARARALAVVGVTLRDLEELAILHGYILEPALRSGTAVAIESRERLTKLDPARFVDPEFAYPYTLERALDAAVRLFRGAGAGRAPAAAVAPAPVALDPEQRRAAGAHDGAVQVIAPAGSGKTAVLIERVRELLRRGVPATRILCTTFNRDARLELRERLERAGLGGVEARTFHSVGLWLMREEGLLRPRGLRGQLSLAQWRRLSAIVAREEGPWIEPADAREAIGWIKLGLLATPAEFRRVAGQHDDGPALARIYELYERQQAEDGVNDFDDLVLVAVRALREDPDLRHAWQARFEHVLVDEYQDIEPAQELLVRILAAPQDGFFCVGDEDQTLYGWRRASVRRILELDLAYPGLERVSLAHNYRCPPEVVEASRRLIEHNRIRFPKPIHAAGAREHPTVAGPPAEDGADRQAAGAALVRAEQGGDRQATGAALVLAEHEGDPQAAACVAERLVGRDRGEIVVLARTTNLLRTVAMACADRGVRISAPDAVFEPHGARGALEAYLRLCAAPADARPDDVALVCRVPGRGLSPGAEETVARALAAGRTFRESLLAAAGDARQQARLDDAGVILDALAGITDASRFIAYLRGPGGLDAYFREYEQTFGGAERIELEVLEHSEREARAQTVTEYSEILRRRTDELHAARDELHGIELTTIHRAKGREWPEVHVFGCDEGQLPHRRALEVSDAERAAGEGIEAERRLAYVAFTRARERLVVHTAQAAASRFLTEAGLGPRRPYADPAPVRPEATASAPAPRRRLAVPSGEAGDVLREALRVGLSYALRTAPNRRAALQATAAAIEQRLVGQETTSQRMTLNDLVAAVEGLTPDERRSLLARVQAKANKRLVGLTRTERGRLLAVLRELASR